MVFDFDVPFVGKAFSNMGEASKSITTWLNTLSNISQLEMTGYITIIIGVVLIGISVAGIMEEHGMGKKK